MKLTEILRVIAGVSAAVFFLLAIWTHPVFSVQAKMILTAILCIFVFIGTIIAEV